ncbi:hypothetical protein SteCoe_33604 [Stentor coeruleus]|uniref:LysM domain-containing protein n=1 Tax=Stentor coeruleus TaxID=5963 RepID=A0A1R2AWB3_9CILI|nr:hypothetical protein SteCoe_33604 [Stentor coeruleus]
MNTDTYTVQENDSLISLSLKFDIPLYSLLRDNQLSEDSIICPGMILKLSKVTAKEQIIVYEQPKLDLNKAVVLYCSNEGDIKGILSYNEYVCIFTPDCFQNFMCIIKTSGGTKELESLDYHQCIDLKDIIEVSLVEYPGYDSDCRLQDNLYLKIILKMSNDQKDSKRHIPKANMYFRFYTQHSSRNTSVYEGLKENALCFFAAFRISLEQRDMKVRQSCTEVTHFMKSDHPLVILRAQYLIYCKNLVNWDVYISQALNSVQHAQIHPHIDSPLKSTAYAIVSEGEENTEYLPALSENSKIFNDSMILQVVSKLPKYLRFRDWDLIYSTDNHGWSLNTFYRNSETYGSNILIIKDQSHSVFGAFASQGWVHSKQYYGNGECFLFSFGTQEIIKCYFATLDNDYYMRSDSECLIMGGGTDSSIYLNQDLTKGYSGKSQTFDNEVLSATSDFMILNIEVWGLV